jgi:hypothetical protein
MRGRGNPEGGGGRERERVKQRGSGSGRGVRRGKTVEMARASGPRALASACSHALMEQFLRATRCVRARASNRPDSEAAPGRLGLRKHACARVCKGERRGEKSHMKNSAIILFDTRSWITLKISCDTGNKKLR